MVDGGRRPRRHDRTEGPPMRMIVAMLLFPVCPLGVVYRVLAIAVVMAFGIAPNAWADDFQTRCQTPGVLRCIGFDQPSDIAGTWGNNTGIGSGASTPTLDTVVKASGNSSLKFTIPSNSPANTSGEYWANFSPDLTTQFGENSDFYVQWRQRFSTEFL